MTRSPPKKVYGNKRLGKMGSAVTYSTDKSDKLVCQPLFHHSNATSSGLLKSYIHSSHNLEGNTSSCLDEAQPELSEQPPTSSNLNEKKREHISVKKLFASKSNNQSREVLKFAEAKPELSEQPSTSKVLNEKRKEHISSKNAGKSNFQSREEVSRFAEAKPELSKQPSTSVSNEKKREHFSSKKFFAGKSNIQSREVVLGIPLQHTYVNRKIHGNLQYLDKETETCYRATSNLKFECHEQILSEPTDNNDDPSDLMEFLQGAKATLQSTFEEIANDCPEFKASASREKNNVLKQLRFYSQRQPVIQNNTMSMTNSTDQSHSQTSYHNVHQDPKSFAKFSHPQEFRGIETTTEDSDFNRFSTPVLTEATPKFNSVDNFSGTFSRRF